MLLTRALKGILSKPEAAVPRPQAAAVKSVLNVGGGSKHVAIPDYFPRHGH
jgi:hypothetical protein